MKEQFTRFFGMSEQSNSDTEREIDEVKQLPLSLIIPNRYQPRTEFDDEKIDELCQTIKTHGIIQPIVVRELSDGRYELIAGERRFRACQRLGLTYIPGIIRNYNDAQSASVALIENLQREGLTAIEEALAYQKLMELHHLTQESLAQRLGKGQSTIANKIRLLQLPSACHDALKSRKITERHARALLILKEEELQLKFLEEIISKDLNVKQTEKAITTFLEKKDEPRKKAPVIRAFSKDVRIALNTIRQSVDMVMKTGLSVETEEEDHEDYYEVKIKIPK